LQGSGEKKKKRIKKKSGASLERERMLVIGTVRGHRMLIGGAI